jgi:hypothetical protein
VQLLVATSLAWAHPVGDRASTQLSVLTVAADHVDVDFHAEVPQDLVELAGGPDRLPPELRAGLLLLVDGEAATLTERRPSPPPAAGDHTWSFALHLRADVAPQRTVELQSANLQETDNFFAGDVWVVPPLRVAACSLWDGDDDRSLRWLRDPRLRTLTVTLAPSAPLGWLTDGVAPRRAFAARGPKPPAGWLALAAAIAALGAGLVWRLRQPR